MAWRTAKCIDVLRDQVNAAYPGRSKSSDGTKGDDAHAARTSDHNPNADGVVCAIDFTHDPAHGLDSEKLANALLASRDNRIKYVISNRKIANSSGEKPWKWRKYTGANPHDQHVHLSVKAGKVGDSTKPWDVALPPSSKPIVVIAPSPGAPSEQTPQGDADLWRVQRRLKAMMYNPGGLDGIWGGLSSGAISGFINDRRSTIPPPTSIEQFHFVREKLKAEISKAEAEKFTRPIAPERAEATPASLAPKLPEVKASVTAERLGFWGSIAAGVSTIVTGVTKFMGDAIEWLNPLKEFVGDLPWPVWVGGALAVSGALYYISRKSGEAKDASTDAFRSGERS